jgi:uncharacterized protein (TIGR02246 family)
LVATIVLVVAVAAPVAADDLRPLLVTIDDLPIANGSLHPDAGERRQLTEELLAALARHDIKAVGLVTWGNLQGPEDEELLEMWLAAGHELGNHSFRHLSLTRSDAETYVADIEQARGKLATFLEKHGRQLRFFRYPMLHEGDTEAKLDAVRAYLEQSGQRNLPVTIDNLDCSFAQPWVAARQSNDTAAMTRLAEEYHESLHVAVRHHERRGDQLLGRRSPQILLLHANAIGAAEWDRLFTWLASTGHRFVTADEVLADPAFSRSHRHVGSKGFGLWDRLAQQQWRQQAGEEVAALMAAQQEAWNRGDLEAFTSGYTDDAIFISPSGMTHGRQAVLDRYRRSYPDSASRGKLSFELIEMRVATGNERSMLDDAQPGSVHAVSLVARWTLTRAGDEESSTGLTLLVFHRRDGEWKLAQDASF